MRIEEIVQAVRVAAGMGIRSIRLTGGEPLVRLGVVDLVRDIANVPGIENISMTTNGVLLPRMADDLKAAGLSRVNISLDTLDSDQFRQITRRGELQQTLDGIDAALEAGFNPVQDQRRGRAKPASGLPEVRRSRPSTGPCTCASSSTCPWAKAPARTDAAGASRTSCPARSCSTPSTSRHAPRVFRSSVAAGEDRPLGWGPARYFMFPGAQGTVGFISPLSRHFCGECNRLRLTADGKLRPCLFSDNEYNLRAALREGDEEAQRAVFAEALRAKPDDHHDRVGTERGMSQIGG